MSVNEVENVCRVKMSDFLEALLYILQRKHLKATEIVTHDLRSFPVQFMVILWFSWFGGVAKGVLKHA